MSKSDLRAILDQGSKAWNTWRKANGSLSIDLTGIDLRGNLLDDIDLSYVDLSGANLNGVYLNRSNLLEANLRGVELNNADLSNANLSSSILKSASMNGTDFVEADLSFADLRESHMNGTNLKKACLIHANLNSAELRGANFQYANLSSADLNRAMLSSANFANCTLSSTTMCNIDFRGVIGLDKINHRGPSTLDIESLLYFGDELPDIFLRGCGVPNELIAYTRSLTNVIQYYTVFISYSRKNHLFVERLYSDLQARGIRCWYDKYDLKTGDPWRDIIDQSIKIYDKVLVILSEDSITSPYVQSEVASAQAKETELRILDPTTTVLFPLRVDDSARHTNVPWAHNIWHDRHVIDFTDWQIYASYQQSLRKLLMDLEQSIERQEKTQD